MKSNTRYDRNNFLEWLLFTASIRTPLLSAKHFENRLLIGQVESVIGVRSLVSQATEGDCAHIIDLRSALTKIIQRLPETG